MTQFSPIGTQRQGWDGGERVQQVTGGHLLPLPPDGLQLCQQQARLPGAGSGGGHHVSLVSSHLFSFTQNCTLNLGNNALEEFVCCGNFFNPMKQCATACFNENWDFFFNESKKEFADTMHNWYFLLCILN